MEDLGAARGDQWAGTDTGRLEAELFAEALALITIPYDRLVGLPERVERLARLAADHGFARIHALARLSEVNVLNRSRDIVTGVKITHEVLRWAAEVGDDLVTARAHALLATGLHRLGAWAESVRHAEAAVRLLDPSAPLQIQADHALILAMLTSCMPTSHVTTALFDRADELARRLGEPIMIVANLNNLAYARYEAGDIAGAAQAVAELRAVAASADLELNASVLDTVASVLLELGDADEAERLVERVLSGQAQLTDANAMATNLLTYAEIKRRAGELPAALEAAEEARRMGSSQPLPEIAAEAMRELAAVRAAMGDYRTAYRNMVRFQAEWEKVRTEQGEAAASVMKTLFEIEALRRDSLRYQELSERDPLTGLWNRRHLERRLPELLRAAGGRAEPVSIGLIDLDHFKQINDKYSHSAGDAVLRTVARILDQDTGPAVFAARLGGEEFLAVFLDSDERATLAACERLRRMIANHPWADQDVALPVTASVGVAVAVPGDTMSTLLRRADEHLYEAKRAGRNRVAGDTPAPRSPHLGDPYARRGG
ncbi:GGDEF domain-containing protein [Phytohabitans rumicis]|uniref:GGDEF domain-containing protein n=1 Tax=Phytohabitans rumicis TaxID=1076125 RepID=A0A6V8LII8_9ACTN|nr:GGDEF domain-containing protein [Phytohabitans rumicis]GFJ93917.1 hypothetical protein Prum_075590 [Phytohabitans rumicis]